MHLWQSVVLGPVEAVGIMVAVIHETVLVAKVCRSQYVVLTLSPE